MREFVLYAASRDWIKEWAGEFIHSIRSHTIQVMEQPDPEWSVYEGFLPD
jgi:hypothetical protein